MTQLHCYSYSYSYVIYYLKPENLTKAPKANLTNIELQATWVALIIHSAFGPFYGGPCACSLLKTKNYKIVY